MKFSYSSVWDDTVRLLRSHNTLLLAIAGVFFMLPSLLTGHFLPAPQASETDPIGPFMDYYRDNFFWVLLGNLVNGIGAIAIYRLLLDRREGTVGTAIAAALPILPFYFLMSMMISFAVGLGLLLFVIPGLYLIGRLANSGAVMVAEGRRNPLEAIAGSWRLTKGRGWTVAGLFLVVALVGFLLSFVIMAVLGSVIIVIGGREGVGGLLVLILSSALTAAVYTVLIVLLAAIYRRLTAAESNVPAA